MGFVLPFAEWRISWFLQQNLSSCFTVREQSTIAEDVHIGTVVNCKHWEIGLLSWPRPHAFCIPAYSAYLPHSVNRTGCPQRGITMPCSRCNPLCKPPLPCSSEAARHAHQETGRKGTQSPPCRWEGMGKVLSFSLTQPVSSVSRGRWYHHLQLALWR